MRLKTLSLLAALSAFGLSAQAQNPIIRDKFTADPAAIVHNGRVYLYTGHDEAPEKHQGYVMKDWLCFSSEDMQTWTEHPSPLKVADFAWAKADAWAGHVIERDGKFFWYVPMKMKDAPGFGIGVAVSDSPIGPFKDALGGPLITNQMTESKITWDDIDPAVFIDKDGQAYLYWGNTHCHYIKLKPNMIEMDGPIVKVDIPEFTEAPWLHERNGVYYLSYATGFPEKTTYATSDTPVGPWKKQGILTELAGNCNTNHQAIIEFKGQWYFIYHNGALDPSAGSFHRSVCVDYLYYNEDGTMRRVPQTTEGTSIPPVKP